MARTATMRLLELMVLKEDIAKVIEYIGKAKCFQFDTDLDESKSSVSNSFKDTFDKLQLVRNFLGIQDVEDYDDDFETGYVIGSLIGEALGSLFGDDDD